MTLIECVPNFSEGRDATVIDAIRARIAGVPGVRVLDVSSDPWHHRTVITFVAPPARAVEAALAGIREATARIDLRRHTGVHPRIGATDVVPFVPLNGATMEQCAALAHELGERVGRELEIPAFLYERAASAPERANLANLRRGGLEGLRLRMDGREGFAPDFGPSTLHGTAGAIAIGARPVLVAWNVYLGPESNLPVARAVARAVRESGGGLPAVKAIGLVVDGQAQLSMNLVDLDRTPLHVAVERARAEAAALGVGDTWSELVGLIPERCLRAAGAAQHTSRVLGDDELLEAGAQYLRMRDYRIDRLLERRL